MERKHNRSLLGFARALRRDMTRQERHLWYDFLRTYPVKFTRQKILGRYIADFYCASAHLVIELDGSQHFDGDGPQKDELRDASLKGYGLETIRIANNDIDGNFAVVCAYIDHAVKARMHGRGE